MLLCAKVVDPRALAHMTWWDAIVTSHVVVKVPGSFAAVLLLIENKRVNMRVTVGTL